MADVRSVRNLRTGETSPTMHVVEVRSGVGAAHRTRGSGKGCGCNAGTVGVVDTFCNVFFRGLCGLRTT